MKKSLRRKLIMSAVAVGAAAVGTTASTYAWFVTNSDVSMNEVTGDVAAANANLSISATSDGKYGVSATPTLTGSALKPVTVSGGKFVNENNQEISGGYYTFSLSFKVTGLETNKKYPLSIKSVHAVDKDKENKKYVAIVDSNSSKTSIKVGDELTEDVTKSLMLSYKASSTAMTGKDVTASNTFHLNNSDATYDAKQYYIDVKKSSNSSYDGSELPAGPTVTNAFDGDGNQVESGNFVITEITSADAVTVQFLVWLNGADEACFDAIAAHAWTLSMNFELGEGTAIAA